MHIEICGEVAVLHAAASLTLAQYTPNQLLLLAAVAQAERLELDLSRVVDIDADGVQWLIMAKRLALARRCSFCLRAASPAVAELLAVCGLAAYFADPPAVLQPDCCTGAVAAGPARQHR